MYFEEPIYYNKKFRIIPNFTRYAIDINGVLLDTKTNEIINPIIDDSVSGKSIYLIELYNIDSGETKIFNSIKALCKKIKHTTRLTNIDGIISELAIKKPNYKITYKRYGVIGPYTVIDIENNKRYILNSIIDVQNKTGINRNTIRSDLSLGHKYKYSNKWIIKQPDDATPLNEYVTKPPSSWKLEITNLDTGETKVYKSLRETSLLTGLTRKSLRYRALKDMPYKQYSFRLIPQ